MARFERVGWLQWWLQAFAAMVYRQLRRFTSARSRLLSAFVTPLLWYVFFGLGWASALGKFRFLSVVLFHGLDYLEYLTPGIVVMTAFTAGFAGGLSYLFDREFGYLKELLVAPASRTAVILGRLLGDALVATLQAFVMLIVLAFVLGYRNPSGLAWVTLTSLLAGLLASAMGTLMAMSVSSPEGFHGLVSIVTMPLIFLSGAFYPINTLPRPLDILALINPLTHPVQLARALMYGMNCLEEPLTYALVGLTGYLVVLIAAVVTRYRRVYVA